MVLFLIAALAPALILFYFVYHKDTQPEPTRIVVKGFFFGVLSAFLAIMADSLIIKTGVYTETPASLGEAIRLSFLGAAIPEECAKLLMLWLLLRNCQAFDERYDGIVYSTAVGLGFAGFENLGYLAQAGPQWMGVAFSRALFAVPGHFAFAVVMGYYYSQYHFKKDKGAMIKMLLYPVLLHGVYDTLCFTMESAASKEGLVTLLVFALLVFFCVKLFGYTRRKILSEAKSNEYYGSPDKVERNGYDVNRDWTDKPEEQ